MDKELTTTTMTFATDNKNIYALAWISWLIGAFFYFYEYFIQVAPDVIVAELMQYFQINATELGNFTLWYFLAYASMQVPAGMLLDKFGIRRLMTTAILFCAIGTMLFASTHLLWLAELSRAITGFGSAFAFLGSALIISNYFPQKYFATLAGLLLTIGMSGAICGEAPLAYLIDHFSWQQTLHILSLVGILWALLAFLILRDGTHNAINTHATKEPPSFRQLWRNICIVVTDTKTWLTAIYGCFMFAPTITIGALWGVSFLVAEYSGLNKTNAATFISLLFFGWVCGAPLFGILSDRLKKRKPPLYISTIGALACSLLILYYPHLPFVIIGALLFAFGFFSSGFFVAFSLCRELHSFRFSGTALGFMNMLNALGAALLPRFAGMILDYLNKNNITAHNISNYSLHDFKFALAVVPVSFIISGILLPFLPETCAQSKSA